jgi:Group II intron, maturase-specific domain
MTNITRFITRRLKLKGNEANSAVARPGPRKFLGFSFSRNQQPKRRISPKALLRCKQKIRELTRRTKGISLEQMSQELAAYLRGWKSYFGFCQTPKPASNHGGMDTASSAIHDLDPVETRQSSVSGTRSAGRPCTTGTTNRGQLRWSLALGGQPRSALRAAHGLLRLARSSSAVGWLCVTL